MFNKKHVSMLLVGILLAGSLLFIAGFDVEAFWIFGDDKEEKQEEALDWPADQLGEKPDLSNLEGEQVELKVWLHSKAFISFMEPIAKKFNKVYPDVDINIKHQQVPYNQLYDSLTTSLIGGTGAPDIVGMEISQTSKFFRPPFASNFKEIKLSDYLEKNLIKQAPYKNNQGELLGVEVAGPHPTFLFYRKDLFDKAGIEMPIETWEQFIEAGKKMKEELGIPITSFPINNITWGSWSELSLAVQNGNPIYNEAGEFVLNNKEGAEAFQLVKDMVYKHEIAVDAEPDDSLTQQRLVGKHSDQIASIVAPLWFPGSRLFNKIDDPIWRVAPVPKFENSPYRTSTWGGAGLSIVESQTEYPKIAEAFVKYLATYEHQIDKFKKLNYLPVLKSALNSEEVKEYKNPEVYGDQVVGKLYTKYTKDLPPVRYGKGWANTSNEITNRLNELEDMSVEKWLDRIAEFQAKQVEE